MEYCIRQSEGFPDVLCGSSGALADELASLGRRVAPSPTLVNLYGRASRIAVLGLGCPMSTLQCIDKAAGRSSRAVGDEPDGEDLEFLYQGEATHIDRRFLLPESVLIRVAFEFIAHGRLDAQVTWIHALYPLRP